MNAGPPFIARYGGVCTVCEQRFAADMTVAYVDDELAHETCVTNPPAAAMAVPPCSRCSMVPAVNGTCGCDE